MPWLISILVLQAIGDVLQTPMLLLVTCMEMTLSVYLDWAIILIHPLVLVGLTR
jgi:hypothetical protein